MKESPKTVGPQGRLEPYGRVGPYGEVLWYLLRDVKREFVSDLTSIWRGREYDALLILQREVEEAVEWLTGAQQTLVDRMITHWPSIQDADLVPAGQSKEDARRALAEQRVRQHRAYLNECRRWLTDLTTDHERGRELLERMLNSLLWPYYFVRFEEKMVTWIPPLELLDPTSGVPSAFATPKLPEEDSPMARTLYPSLYGALSGEGNKVNELLRRTLDTANSNLDDRRGEVGYVQPFEEEAPGFVAEIIDKRQANERVWFVDALHLNRTGFRWSHVEEDETVGRLWWCGPTKSLPRSLARVEPLWHPPKSTSADAIDNFIEELSRAAWERAGGSVIAHSIKQRYITTVGQYLPTVKQEATFNAMGLIGHSMQGALSAFSLRLYEDPKLQAADSLRLLYTERLVIQAARVGFEEAAAKENGLNHVLEKWDGFVDDGKPQPFGRVLESLYGQDGEVLLVKDAPVVGRAVDPRLMAILIELCRNIYKYHDVDAPPVSVKIMVDGQSVSLAYATYATRLHVRNLRKRLVDWNDATDPKGVQTVAWLASTLGGFVSWSIEAQGEAMCDIMNRHAGYALHIPVAVRGPDLPLIVKTTPLPVLNL